MYFRKDRTSLETFLEIHIDWSISTMITNALVERDKENFQSYPVGY